MSFIIDPVLPVMSRLFCFVWKYATQKFYGLSFCQFKQPFGGIVQVYRSEMIYIHYYFTGGWPPEIQSEDLASHLLTNHSNKTWGFFNKSRDIISKQPVDGDTTNHRNPHNKSLLTHFASAQAVYVYPVAGPELVQPEQRAGSWFVYHTYYIIYIYTLIILCIYICIDICIMSILDIFDIRSSEYSRSQYETTSRFASSRISTWEQQNRSVGFGNEAHWTKDLTGENGTFTDLLLTSDQQTRLFFRKSWPKTKCNKI